jgi:hypothetical protein
MKRSIATMTLIVSMVPCVTLAQTTTPAPPTGQKTLAATMGVYAFPQKGQDASQQSQDESACYQGAVQQSGVDPFHLQKQAAAQAEQNAAAQQNAAQNAGKGAVAGGVVKGAAAGAVVGSVSNGSSSGEGAAVGAAVGVAAGARRKRQAQAQAQQQVQAQGEAQQQATQAQMTEFKKAFSACLQSKNYQVQY